MAREIVYIGSLGHSGSTLVCLVLGTHPRMIGLGEVYSLFAGDLSGLLDRTDTLPCSCGQSMDQCRFWGPVSRTLRENPSWTLARKYALVVNSFFETFGEDAILVDSSKTLTALSTLLAGADGARVRLLQVIKDVRAWVVGIRDRHRRRSEFRLGQLLKKYGPRGLLRYPKRMAPALWWHWYRANRRYHRFARRRGLEWFGFGYDELCLAPDELLPHICDFIGVETLPEMRNPVRASSHSILGNRLGLSDDSAGNIRHDIRMLYRNDWLLPAVLMPWVLGYNARAVYGHVNRGRPEYRPDGRP